MNIYYLLKLTGSFGFDFAHHKFRHGLTQIYAVDIKTGFPLRGNDKLRYILSIKAVT